VGFPPGHGPIWTRNNRPTPACGLVPGAVAAGDRAPDAPATTADGRPIRLFDLFRGPHWTLLAFGAAHAQTVAALGDRFGPALRTHTVVRPGEPADRQDVIDSDGRVRTGYDLADGTLALVRPDGYLGLITSPGSIERVDEYWAALHGAPAPAAAPDPGTTP
jgi:hypothetical protein